MFFALLACSHDDVRRGPSPFELRIGKDLEARFGVAATAQCEVWGEIPLACGAWFADGGQLVIHVRDAGAEWEWWIDGTVVATAPIAAHVRALLDELGVAQEVRCGPSAKVIAPGERIECALGGGGKAFAMVGADGDTAIELALDPAAAAARSEPALDLEKRSRALAANEDDEDEVPVDGGVAAAEAGVR